VELRVVRVQEKKRIVGVIFADLSFSLLPRSGRLEDSSIDFVLAGGWLLGSLLAAWATASCFFGGGLWHLLAEASRRSDGGILL
jgi:hypothetical protein